MFFKAVGILCHASSRLEGETEPCEGSATNNWRRIRPGRDLPPLKLIIIIFMPINANQSNYGRLASIVKIAKETFMAQQN